MSAPFCAVDSRRDHVRAHAGLTGLDWVEVDETQTRLSLYFLGRAPAGLTPETLAIEGGRSERDRVRVTSVDLYPAEDERLDDLAVLHVDKPGDYSTYTLRLLGLGGIDPRYASLDFSFKANCPSDLDCRSECRHPEPQSAAPAIDYLGKDYASFRQLILDRLALVCPDWDERHAPDIGTTLVELLAYTGDYLSYYQDAVATEAYLGTARRRTSIRRHARLVDYRLGEGCNARAFVAVGTGADLDLQAQDISFTTRIPGAREAAALTALETAKLPADDYEVFEPLGAADVRLRVGHNSIAVHSWGGRECCLEAGSTSAWLRGRLAGQDDEPPAEADAGEEAEAAAPVDEVPTLDLRAGDILIFEELLGPLTGKAADADPAHRQAVRLTAVRPARDELLGLPLVEIEWHPEDALRFDLCLTATGPAPDCQFLDPVSVARGNVVLVDHGRSLPPEPLGAVPRIETPACCACEGFAEPGAPLAGRYRPVLERFPLTYAAQPAAGSSAAALLRGDAARALPAIALDADDGSRWMPALDLLGSGPAERSFVVEHEEDGSARLRFGDGLLGSAPAAGASFAARYRVGNGTSGNVGAGAIAHLVHRDSDLSNDILWVHNPVAAAGGTRRETIAEAVLMAPTAFRYGPDALQRAVTADDYARIAERDPRVQGAAGCLAWTGSWYCADVALDTRAAAAADFADVASDCAARLEPVRRIGHDLFVGPVEQVPIDLAIHVCVARGHIAAHVKAALLERFGSGSASGLFHADALLCGAPVRLSALLAAAHSVPGVASAHVTRLQRQFAAPAGEIEAGLLALGPREVAILANDPNHPEGGKLDIDVEGGR